MPLICLFWLIGLTLLYFWLRGRLGKTCILVEPDRLVTKVTLFGRTKMKHYGLDADSRASLVSDFHVNSVNHHRGSPVYHVHVTTTDRPAKFGTFLSRQEQDWIVAQINRHLGLEEERGECPES